MILQDDVNKILDCNSQMIQLLDDYKQLTSVLMACESEQGEEIARLIHCREVIIDSIKDIKERLLEIVETLDDDDKTAVKNMYNKQDSSRKKSGLMLDIQSSVLNLSSVQQEVQIQEEALLRQFDSRSTDVKDKLISLKQDKGRINYYTRKVGTQKPGNYFDSTT